jgi:hypothetical protein
MVSLHSCTSSIIDVLATRMSDKSSLANPLRTRLEGMMLHAQIWTIMVDDTLNQVCLDFLVHVEHLTTPLCMDIFVKAEVEGSEHAQNEMREYK